jgi:hypothetical protein
MSDSTVISLVSLAVSILAATVSAIAMWRAYFSRFNPLVTVGSLRQRLYPIRSGGEKWFVFLFDLPVAFANAGARPGRVLGLRLHLHFPDVPIPGNYERIYASREVDHVKTAREAKDFFAWLEEVQLAEWMPFMVTAGGTVHKHFHFQTRWDQPVVQRHCECALEILSDSSRKWKRAARWQITLDKAIWSELLTHGNTISFSPEGDPERHKETHPTDLHKYVSSRDGIPMGGLGGAPSYLDWPDGTEGKDNNESASA